MAYSTDFFGEFSIEPALSDEDREFLIKFNSTRRMARQGLDPKYGLEGEWLVSGEGFKGQDSDSSVINHNKPPCRQPGLWCQWVPNEDGTALQWDGGEMAYDMREWLYYLIEFYLKPRGYVLNGVVKAQGKDSSDRWSMRLKDNALKDGCPAYEQFLPKIEEIKNAKLEDLPKFLADLKELKSKKRGLTVGGAWYLSILEERLVALEGADV